MMDDPDYYKYALGIAYAIPSAETLRQRFEMIEAIANPHLRWGNRQSRGVA